MKAFRHDFKLSNPYFKKGYDLGFKDGVKIAVEVILYSVIQYLGDKRGWKRERIFDALLWLHKHAEMLLEEYTTFPEVQEAVLEEYGIGFKDGKFILYEEKKNADTKTV